MRLDHVGSLINSAWIEEIKRTVGNEASFRFKRFFFSNGSLLNHFQEIRLSAKVWKEGNNHQEVR